VKNHATLARALWLTAALLLAGCVHGPVQREGRSVPYEEAASADLSRARAHLAAGELVPARDVLETFLRELGRSRQTDEALWLLGDVYERLQQRERAAETWARLVRSYPESPRNAPAALRAAAVYRELGKPEQGRALLARAPWERADEVVRVRIQRLRAELARQAGDYGDALLALALARRDVHDPAALSALDADIADLLGVRISEAELERTLPQLPRGPVYDRANLALARHALARSDFGDARGALARLPQALVSSAIRT